MARPTISERLRRDADPIWKEIFHHPFVVELYQGNLPLEKFKFYVLQDYNFLVSMMKNFGILSAKAESVAVMRELLGIAHLEATSEFTGYEELLKKLGYTIEDAIKAPPTQVNTSYMNFLLATATLKTFWEGLTATLPCFWTYAEIAEFHKDRLKQNKNGLYAQWASVYSSEPYLTLVKKLKGLLDRAHLVDYKRLREAFIIASKYEYEYWGMAYSKEAWLAPAKER